MDEKICVNTLLKFAFLKPNTNNGSNVRIARTFKSTPKINPNKNIVKIGARINGLDTVTSFNCCAQINTMQPKPNSHNLPKGE
jgi:hypothetical protein